MRPKRLLVKWQLAGASLQGGKGSSHPPEITRHSKGANTKKRSSEYHACVKQGLIELILIITSAPLVASGGRGWTRDQCLTNWDMQSSGVM